MLLYQSASPHKQPAVGSHIGYAWPACVLRRQSYGRQPMHSCQAMGNKLVRIELASPAFPNQLLKRCSFIWFAFRSPVSSVWMRQCSTQVPIACVWCVHMVHGWATALHSSGTVQWETSAKTLSALGAWHCGASWEHCSWCRGLRYCVLMCLGCSIARWRFRWGGYMSAETPARAHGASCARGSIVPCINSLQKCRSGCVANINLFGPPSGCALAAPCRTYIRSGNLFHPGSTRVGMACFCGLAV